MAFPDRIPVVNNVLYGPSGTVVSVFNEAGKDRVAVSGTITDGTNVAAVNTSGELAVTFQGGTADIFGVDMSKIGETADGYYMFIDLDGASYKHTAGTKVMLHQVSGHLIKSRHDLDWKVSLAVILDINATDADYAILGFTDMHTENSALFQVELGYRAFPDPADLGVTTGALTRIAASNIVLADVNVNTTGTLTDVSGAAVTPAIGDIIIVSDNINTGSGTADFHFSANYEVK